jgi:hypothetical protein
MSQHTISIFQMTLDNLPPLLPPEIAAKMRVARDEMASNGGTSMEMIENTMIKFGYELWPWREAHREFLSSAEERLGEHFFLSRLPAGLNVSFTKYRDYGLDWRDVYSGRAINYFADADRPILARVLVETKNDLSKFTEQEVASVNKSKYLSRVGEFKKILEKIKNVIGRLKSSADKEEYHPTLADEMRARARHLELGLAELAPSPSLDEASLAQEFFDERKIHLNMLRGIDKPIQVDFYNLE